MAVPAAITLLYNNEETAVVALAEYVKATVQTFCMGRNYLFSSRVKSAASLSEKLESGRYASWSDVDDRFACTVVVPTVTHEEGVLQFLRAAFNEIECRERNSTQKAPDVFRFDSTRWIGSLAEPVSDSLAPGAHRISFAVQIQTVFEFAWGVVTHDLVYKSDSIDWRKARLAAQLRAAVEQIELTIATFEESAESLPKSSHPETDEKVSLISEMKQLIADKRITAEMEPESWSRFADNVTALVKSYTSGARNVPAGVAALREGVVYFLRNDDAYVDLRSGSLFQVVLGIVAAGHVEKAHLKNFTVVPSGELSAFHEITSLPKLFDMPS